MKGKFLILWCTLWAAFSAQAAPLFPVVLVTDWFAQAEHGGFYQALAEGIYQKRGLDVKIKMGGPQVQGLPYLLSGQAQFFMPSSYFLLAGVHQDIPIVGLAALFQKDITILMAHPGVGNDSLENLRGKPINIAPGTAAAIWPFLTAKYGYIESQRRPYPSSLGIGFLAQKNIIQEGLLSSEPFQVEKQGGFKPNVFLLSESGYAGYGEVISTTKSFLKQHPEIVRSFVLASLEGWKSYLVNPKPANILIKKDNPQMRDDLLAYGLRVLKEREVITGGEARQLGLGAMNPKRWDEFLSVFQKLKVFPSQLKADGAYTLEFVNQRQVMPPVF